MDDYTPFADPGRVRVRGATVSHVGVARRPSVPVAQTYNYGQADWEASSFGLFGEGADPAACPECGRCGFFGPRYREPDIKYRSCRFCGFWQQVDHSPEKYLPTVHDCAAWPRVSKAAYLWWVHPQLDSYSCPFCERRVDVPLSIVPAPSEDDEHPWWRIPQHKSQSVYQRLWNNWECSAGRTIL